MDWSLRGVEIEHRHELVPQPVRDVRSALRVTVPEVEDGLQEVKIIYKDILDMNTKVILKEPNAGSNATLRSLLIRAPSGKGEQMHSCLLLSAFFGFHVMTASPTALDRGIVLSSTTVFSCK